MAMQNQTIKLAPFQPESLAPFGRNIQYKKYHLSAEEVAFIETMIKPMA
jgi:hypothetical protein